METAVQFLSVCATDASTISDRPRRELVSIRDVIRHLLQREIESVANTDCYGGEKHANK